MTDTLVARLRDAYPKFIAFTDIPHMASEAADRIEALQAKIEEHTALCVKRVAEVTRERNQLRAEVERLKSEREGIIQRSNEIISSLAVGAAPKTDMELINRGCRYETELSQAAPTKEQT